jgi:predicted DNA-binding protein (MmcQ/YjbR family)
MMDHKKVEKYLLSFPNTWLDYPFGESVAVYKVGKKSEDGDDEKMFALIMEGKNPVRLSLKCDPQLAQVLRDKYDEIMPGYHLNKKHWNTLILSGQLEWDEVKGLIRLSYDLVAETI